MKKQRMQCRMNGSPAQLQWLEKQLQGMQNSLDEVLVFLQKRQQEVRKQKGYQRLQGLQQRLYMEKRRM